MTGIATDIGNILGQACRKDNHAEVWRLYVHVPILASYCFGGFLGEGAYYLLREHSLLIPCIFTGATAAIYLSLPFIQTAAETFKGREKRIRADFVPGRGSTLEIRMVGDPRQVGGGIITVADPAKKLPGLNGVSDLEIREFFGDVNDSFEELDLEQAKKRSVVGVGNVVAGADVREVQQVQKSAKTYVGVSADEGSSEVLTTGGASEK
ncbi:hypothetical protein CcCBS67573_g10556 [Chytriomyces confervae]|uniref:Uncharacterized protein n=1 Tax=Chytriomyces confervae TaxID=246404 RepID=A0A507CRK5_9FUNG|nr:hypothetical protein CcCBS67573_g10556 [Chytriomyces confervae]